MTKSIYVPIMHKDIVDLPKALSEWYTHDDLYLAMNIIIEALRIQNLTNAE